MQSLTRQAIVIGETKLCIQCIEYLAANKWKIILIVSDDRTVIDWAKNNSISILPTSKLSTIKENNFYLFSIINPCLIPKSFLEDNNILLAINYHDSPLPRYAGINSTTWAIINNEKTHGITLHQILPGVDDGNIAAQSIIDIDKDETALSLNLKCSEQMFLQFKEVLIKIESGTLTFTKQNLDERTYYGAKYIPENYGIVNGTTNLKTLYILVRGLTFGSGYNNQVASVKIVINDQFYILEDFNAEPIKSDNEPDSNTALFNTVRDIYGNKTNIKITYSDILTTNELTSDALQYLSNIKALERKNRKQILEILDNPGVSIEVLGHNYVANESDNKHTQEFSIPNNISTTKVLAITYLVLARFFYDSNFVISLYVSDNFSIPKELRGLVENRNFIHTNTNMLSYGFAYLENYLNDLQKNCLTLTKDFSYRYNLQLLTDIAITIGNAEHIDKHKLIIKLEDSKLAIEGASTYQLQIDGIVESVKAMLSKNIQEDIATKDLTKINILDNTRYQQIVYDWNKTERDYPKDKTIHQLFEEQVLKTPNNIAVVYEDIKITYQELNNKANQLANYLIQNYDIKPDDLIALCLDRSEHMLIAILGVLKSGGAYVPIDPNYPNERIGYVLSDTMAKAVLTNDVHINKIKQIIEQKNEIKTDVIAIDSKEMQIKLAKQKNINPITSTKSESLSYVIYTSGTTGNSKGVLVEHHSVVNYITYLVNFSELNNKSVGSQYASFSFDAFVCESYPILLSGGTLHIVPDQDKLDPIKINDFFCKNNVTYGFLPTKFAELFFNLKNNSLMSLVVAGEKLEKFTKQSYRVSNGYGPTESTVHTTNFIVDKQYKNIPIGKPIYNVKCYIVDNNTNILPISAIGELMIGGECLARGYLNHINLTAEKFISNPFQTEEEKSQNKNNRIYKTGDLVRLLPNGNIEYIGRKDSQVKIRGYRIELGEIENKLLNYPDVKQAIVLVKYHVTEQTNDKYILAYYVSDKKLDKENVLAQLTTQLPEYMVPHILIQLSKLPLTANGKLDKKALPEPEFTNQSEYIAPRSELEKNICEIYAQVLNLPVAQVGIKNDFFEMGGDSISSIRLSSQIRQKLELNVSVNDIFSYRNIEQLVANVLTSQSIQKEKAINIKQKDVLAWQTDMPQINQEYLNKIKENIEVEDAYLANNLQQGFIYHAIRQGKADDAYLSQFIWKYKIQIDGSKFKIAWQFAQKKYPSLRLRFAWDKELIQIIDKKQELDFRYIDLTNSLRTASPDHQSQIENIVNQDRQEHYDLRKGSLIRIYLIKSSENDYLCICSIHHIILDGWSLSLLIDSAHEIYSQLLTNNQPQISEDITYKEAQKYLQEHKNKDKEYWDDQIKQIKSTVDLKILLKPSATNTEIKNHTQIEQEQEQHAEITEQNFFKLKAICQTNAVTMNAVMQYAWHKILHIYGFSSTTVVGTAVSGRNIPVDNIENSVGLFINTLPLIFAHYNKSNLIKQIKIIQNSINEANSKSNVNLADIQPDGIRLFDSLLIYENYPPQKDTTDIKCEDMRAIFKVDYPLAIIVYEKEQTLKILLKYAGELFDQETVSQLLNKLLFFIEQISKEPHRKTLSYLSQKEYQALIIDHNKTEKAYPLNKTIHQLFEEQVLKTPNNIALVYEDKKLTYRELNNRTNQLANYILKNNDIKPDDLIALILSRSEFIIISILAVLKTGAAYVPIDPKYPGERIKYILQDTKAKVIIKDKNVKYTAKQSDNVIEVDSEEFTRVLLKEDISNTKTNISSANLAYVLYTSGTTGKPKGVMLEHNGCVNRILEMIRISQIKEHNKILFKTNYVFDVSFSDIFAALLAGTSLFVTKEVFDIEEISTKIKNHSIDVCHFTPSQFDVIKNIKGIELFEKFKVLHFSGEALDLKLLEGLDKNIRCINYYGPTEAGEITFDTCSSSNPRSLIGYPISNAKLFILDKYLTPLPIDAVGELYLGGICLARGYLNQLELTKERFIPNPFQTPEEKSKNINCHIYKTGDLVRMLPDGNIEYLGRNDFQIKIRGYRIEIGEIEDKLVGYPKIKQAIVIVEEKTNDKYLVGYYVTDKKLDSQKIKNYLLKLLPEHMIPSAFVHMQKLPLTTNGKLDKEALPKSEFKNKDLYEAPSNEKECLICTAFEKVLGLQKVGSKDDFFSLGGNSIQAIRLTSVLQTNFDVKIADIFNLRTPNKIAKRAVFGKNFLQHKLELVKIAYIDKKNKNKHIDVKSQQKISLYTEATEGLRIDVLSKKPIHSVLLTGSTGYLGCNILNQLLELTDYKVYLLVRSNSKSEAFKRINKKYKFYFDESINNVLDSRIFVIKSDIEKDYLDLTKEEYIDLITKIDSVIHAAALVKHYGEYNKFYSANVSATINLLEFTKLTKLKDFHYISTTGVLNLVATSNSKQCVCTEDDLPNSSEVLNNVYVQTKLSGEKQVIKYRDYGMTCNIYRVGNLAFMSNNYRAQKNIDDNAFYNWLKCLFTIKSSSEIINTVEISQTDLTAQAIVKIFDKKYIKNQVHHIFNPCLFDMTNVFKDMGFNISPIGAFVDCILQHIKDGSYYDLIVKFLLYQGWIDLWREHNTTTTKILQNRTQYILKNLNFEWPSITSEIVYNYLNALKLNGDVCMTNKAKIFTDLERFAPLIPAPVSWLDINGCVLGANDIAFENVGDPKLVIGKTPYDFYPNDVAAPMMEHIQKVIQEKKPISFEEPSVEIKTGKTRWFVITRAPLFDDDGINVIGVVATAIEITERKEAERLRIENEYQKIEAQEQIKFKKLVDQTANDVQSPLAVLLVLIQHCSGLTKDDVFKVIKKFANTTSVNLYWLDDNNVALGANQKAIEDIGGCYITDLIGKTAYDLYPDEMAENIIKHNNLVMQTGKILSHEEPIRDVTTGETKYFTSFKAPLYDNNGKIIGILGTSADITTQKNAERLKLETEIQKIKIQEQEAFREIIAQASHDIRSPLTSIKVFVKQSQDLPEQQRIVLREISARVDDVANNLLYGYKKFEAESSSEPQKPQHVLVLLAISEIISSKRYKYSKLPVKFNLLAKPNCNFAFIKVDRSNFKRTIANIINNAVEAFEEKEGSVDTKLSVDNEQVKIEIQDNGKGIPPDVLEKIINNVSVTSGKENGSGIGLTQVRSTLSSGNGKMLIKSEINIGTTITIIFPITESPNWIAKEITLHKDDTVVVLDDDPSIHGAWDMCFKDHKEVHLKHFENGEEAIGFINTFPEKHKLFLLADFELINQELNGLQIIEKTAMQHQSILVTSHYENKEVHDLADEIGVKILPKQLAPETTINIEETERNKCITNCFKKTSLVIIDDDQTLADSTANFLKDKFEGVEVYYHPNNFLKNLHLYDKNTTFCIDHDFKDQIDGFELAKQLNEMGYTKLYLLTGRSFEKGEVPDYLTVILKGDLDGFDKLV